MTVALEDLKTADWSDIQSGCYGSSEDVIELLHLLAFDSENSKADSNELGSALYHQGDVYETTARAIPYMVELIRSDDRRHQDLHSNLLVCLAIFHGGSGVDYYKKPRIVDRITQLVGSVITDGLPVYLERLSDEREDVRLASLLLLGCLHHEAKQILPLVRERYSEAINPLDRAATLFCIGRLSPDDRQTLLHSCFFDPNESEIVRLMVAINLAEKEDEPLDPILSKLFTDNEPEPLEDFLFYLKRAQMKYGKVNRAEIDDQFAAIVFTEDLDVTLETLLADE